MRRVSQDELEFFDSVAQRLNRLLGDPGYTLTQSGLASASDGIALACATSSIESTRRSRRISFRESPRHFGCRSRS